MAVKSPFLTFAKQVANDHTDLASEGASVGEFTGYIDTGSYAFNALLSGSIFGGLPNNQITELCGESTTGKTFFIMALMRAFQAKDPLAAAMMFETEAAVNRNLLVKHGVDPERLIISNSNTIQAFTTQALQALNAYEKGGKEFPFMLVLDSLGGLTTDKELKDTTEGSGITDMTRARMIRAAFRTLTLKLAKVQVPFVLTNHTYTNVNAYGAPQVASGGGGVKYAASTIVMLSKAKDKEDKEVVGVFITANLIKSRVTKENSKVKMRLSYKTGLDRYYGLIDIAEEAEVFKKVGPMWQLPDGSKVYEKVIDENPEKYYTKDVLEQLDEAAGNMFRYGE